MSECVVPELPFDQKVRGALSDSKEMSELDLNTLGSTCSSAAAALRLGPGPERHLVTTCERLGEGGFTGAE